MCTYILLKRDESCFPFSLLYFSRRWLDPLNPFASIDNIHISLWWPRYHLAWLFIGTRNISFKDTESKSVSKRDVSICKKSEKVRSDDRNDENFISSPNLPYHPRIVRSFSRRAIDSPSISIESRTTRIISRRRRGETAHAADRRVCIIHAGPFDTRNQRGICQTWNSFPFDLCPLFPQCPLSRGTRGRRRGRRRHVFPRGRGHADETKVERGRNAADAAGRINIHLGKPPICWKSPSTYFPYRPYARRLAAPLRRTGLLAAVLHLPDVNPLYQICNDDPPSLYSLFLSSFFWQRRFFFSVSLLGVPSLVGEKIVSRTRSGKSAYQWRAKESSKLRRCTVFPEKRRIKLYRLSTNVNYVKEIANIKLLETGGMIKNEAK